jgi:uncharacterized membrane protein
MHAYARVGWGALAGLAYIATSHWLMTAAPASAWNTVALRAPMLMLTALWCWRGGRRAAAAVAVAALCALTLHAASGATVPDQLLYFGQHVVIHLSLAAWFAVTLRRGAQALISRVALRVHGHLTPAMARYTRAVTAAWAAYFVAIATLSAVLFALAPFDTWALFANWLTPIAAAAMFAVEHRVRYRLHPEFERASIPQAIRAYSQLQARATPSPSRPGGLAEPW